MPCYRTAGPGGGHLLNRQSLSLLGFSATLVLSSMFCDFPGIREQGRPAAEIALEGAQTQFALEETETAQASITPSVTPTHTPTPTHTTPSDYKGFLIRSN